MKWVNIWIMHQGLHRTLIILIKWIYRIQGRKMIVVIVITESCWIATKQEKMKMCNWVSVSSNCDNDLIVQIEYCQLTMNTYAKLLIKSSRKISFSLVKWGILQFKGYFLELCDTFFGCFLCLIFKWHFFKVFCF